MVIWTKEKQRFFWRFLEEILEGILWFLFTCLTLVFFLLLYFFNRHPGQPTILHEILNSFIKLSRLGHFTESLVADFHSVFLRNCQHFWCGWSARFLPLTSWSFIICLVLSRSAILFAEAATRGVLWKKSVPINFAKFTGKNLCQSLFFNNDFNFLIRLAHLFFYEFCEISKNTFSTEHFQTITSGSATFSFCWQYSSFFSLVVKGNYAKRWKLLKTFCEELQRFFVSIASTSLSTPQ